MAPRFDNTYARLPDRFFARVKPTPVEKPAMLVANEALGETLGLSAAELADPGIWSGNTLLEGSEPIALAYAGHQFGHLVPQLGDGRAILLGEIVGTDGVRRDVQLKGSGRTPFSRGGDGRAALGPVLRELLVSEAMHALGVPTTRALAAVTTGERVYRESVLPGAIVTRVASSHLRVGTFQYFAVRGDRDAVAELTAYALARHYPDAKDPGGPALALLEAVMEAQMRLVSKWLALGFVHGVMNTDNCTISGETIDYGPCAFLDAYDPSRTFSSIDQQSRYAYARQPGMVMWNLARLAETLLPQIEDGDERAIAAVTERLETFPARFEAIHLGDLRKKLGLSRAEDGDLDLARALLAILAEAKGDFTRSFRLLADAETEDGALRVHLNATPRLDGWLEAWRARLGREANDPSARRALMRSASPAFIPRNHRVEEMIAAAHRGDLSPLTRLRRVLARPYDDQPEAIELGDPPGEEQWGYATFCGT